MRKFHAYCIGTPRSGTRSLADVFGKQYRTRHEAAHAQTIEALLTYFDGKLECCLLKRFMEQRDASLDLELEASHFLHHVCYLLSEAFPDCRFLLPVRHPLEWIESEANVNFLTHEEPVWRRLETFRYGRYQNAFSSSDRGLSRYPGVWPVESYFRYWSEHNRLVLDTIPSERLIVFPTKGLQAHLKNICDFLGATFSTPTLDFSKAHSKHLSRRVFHISELVDPIFLRDMMLSQCRETMSRLEEFGIDLERSQRNAEGCVTA